MSAVLAAGEVGAGASFATGAATTTGAGSGVGAFWRTCSMSLAAGAVTAGSLSSKDGDFAAGAMVSGSAPAVMLFLRRTLQGQACRRKALA